jgi:putative heme-binding domain-containing protein
MLNAPAAAAGGRGGTPAGGRGGAAAPAAPAIPGASQLQTLLVTGLEAAAVPQLQAVTAARTALTTASLNADAATITARANALADAELALATARAVEFAKIQASAAKFNAQQVAALAAQQAVAAPPAAAGRGGAGGGGRGGATGPTPVQVAQQAVINTPAIDEVYSLLIDEAAKLDGENSQLADSALVTLAGRRFGATAPRDAAAKALDAGWADPARRAQIIMAAVTARDTSLASRIVAAQNDSDAAVARAATYAIQQLNIDVAGLAARASQPKVGEMTVEQALAAVVPAKGSIIRGQQLTRELGCVSCHGFGPGGEPKGPDLSKVSGILARRELAEAILVPNKTISQGFPATTLDLKNGTSILGFVVGDGGGFVTIRTVEAKNTRIASADIAKRTAMEVSLMPPVAGDLTVTEFASLLDYIESLSKP